MRILRIRAAGGDLEALQRRAEEGGGWAERLAWARRLASLARREEAAAQYRLAAEAAPGPVERFAVLEEASGASAAGASPGELADALEERRRILASLPGEAGREAWEAHARRVEGRVRFALGEFEAAASLLSAVAPLDAADAYLAALAAKGLGHRDRASDLLRVLEGAGDPAFSRLASVRRRCAELREEPR